MNKKAVIFTSIILFFGILSVNSLATGHSKNNFFDPKTGNHEFVWNIQSDFNVSEDGVIVTTPQAIEVNKTIVDNGENVTIHLEGNDLSEGVYIVTATLNNQYVPISTFNLPIIVGMATNSRVDNEIENLDDEIDGVSENLNDEVDSLSNRISEAEEDIEDLQDKLSNIKSSGSERESKLSSLDNNLTELVTKFKNLKTELNKYEKKLKKVKSTTSTGMIFTSASLGIGILVLIVLVLYLGLKKGLFKRILQASQQQYKEKVQKKEPWER